MIKPSPYLIKKLSTFILLIWISPFLLSNLSTLFFFNICTAFAWADITGVHRHRILEVTHHWRGWHHLTQMLSHNQTPFSLSDNMNLYMCPAALGLSFAPLKLLGEVRQQLSFLSHIFGDQVASYLLRKDRAADNLQLWLTLLAPLYFKYIIFNIHWREWSVSWNSFGSIAARVPTTRKMEGLTCHNFWRAVGEFN